MTLEFNRSIEYVEGELGEGTGRRIPLRYLYIGVVMDNNDSLNMGRIRVWVPELSDDMHDEDGWVTCSPVSPFAGSSPLVNNVKNSNQYTQSQTSYGFIAQPPDLYNFVLIAFIGGKPNFAVYIGFLHQMLANHMVPGIAVSNVPGTREKLPAGEVNKFSNRPVTASDDTTTRPVFTPLARALENQGLESDNVRGPTDASMRRDSPPNVYGLISPRGHHFYIDDGKLTTGESIRAVVREENNTDIQRRRDQSSPEYIRFRTRNGVQILINDTDGYIYFITREGNSWAELSDVGINFYSKENINFRTEKNFNVHADGYFNVFGTLGINVATDGAARVFSQQNFNILSAENIFMKGMNKVTFLSEELIAFDSKRVEFQKKLAVEPEAPIIIEIPDLDSETKASRNTRSIVTQMPYHEPFPHGFRDRANERFPSRGSTSNLSQSPEHVPNTADLSSIDLSDMNIGSCAKREESGGRPDAINRNDVGKPSYGMAQIRGAEGMARYMAMIRDRYPEIFDALQKAGGPVAAERLTPEFVATWQNLAKEPTRQRFIESQQVVILAGWYKPTLQQIKAAIGEDFSTRSAGIKDMVYSLGVQHGPAGGAGVVKNALAGLNVRTLSDEEILRRVYAERGSVNQNGILKYFPKFSAQVGAQNARQQLQDRYARELQCNLNKMRADFARRNVSNNPDVS